MLILDQLLTVCSNHKVIRPNAPQLKVDENSEQD